MNTEDKHIIIQIFAELSKAKELQAKLKQTIQEGFDQMPITYTPARNKNVSY